VSKLSIEVPKGLTREQVEAVRAQVEHLIQRAEAGSYIIRDKNGNPKLDLAKLAGDLLAEFGFKTLVDTDELLVYRDGVWSYGGEAFVQGECQRRLEVTELLTRHKVEEVIGHIKRSTHIDRRLFNREKYLVNLKNGVLDVHSRELLPHSSDFLSTICIPVPYDTEVDCPRIKQFLAEVLSPEDIPVIEELFGYCLIPDYTIQRSFLFVGEGSNGKSTLLNLLKAFIGGENCANVPWHALELDRFAKSALEGKLVNLFADLPTRGLNTTTAFKMLTGGDSIGTEKKFRDFYSFVNFARLVYSTNRPPKVYDEDSYAFWRRWVIIRFPNQFTGAGEDKAILSKLTTETELSGLLNLALIGLEHLLKNGDFSYTKTVDETTEFYQRTADPVYAFIQDCCEADPDGEVPKDELYEGYKQYCDAQKIPKLKPNSFARALQNQANVRVISIRLKVGGERPTAWRGITWVKVSKVSKVFPSLKVVLGEGSVEEAKIENNIGIPDNPDPKTKVADIPDYPTAPCPTCGSINFWLTPDNRWLCCRCHPKPK
jgi:putative DNA primase/helicase